MIMGLRGSRAWPNDAGSMKFMLSRPSSWLVIAAITTGLGSPAYADDDDDKPRPKLIDGRGIQFGNGIELGAIMQGGYTEFGSNNLGLSPNVQGLVLRDRNGITSRMVIGLLIAVAGALAQSGPKSVESKSYRSGDYIVTETTTTYYSEAEKAEMSRATSDSVDGLFSAKYADFELHLFSRDRFELGDASGYKLNMLIGGEAGSTFGVETGLGFGKVNSIVNSGGMPVRIDYKYLGMPFRLTAVAGPLRFALTYEWNWLKYGIEDTDRQIVMGENGVASTQTASHPWHFEASTLLLKRIAVSGGVTAQTLQTKVGYFASAGIFF
jgi:hypothetical protein